MWLLKRLLPKTKDPDYTKYLRFMILYWVYTFVWISALFLTYLKWQPRGIWAFLAFFVFTALAPDIPELFFRFEDYKKDRKKWLERTEKEPKWLEEMRKR